MILSEGALTVRGVTLVVPRPLPPAQGAGAPEPYASRTVDAFPQFSPKPRGNHGLAHAYEGNPRSTVRPLTCTDAWRADLDWHVQAVLRHLSQGGRTAPDRHVRAAP